MLKDLSSELIRTAYRSPWQNGLAERWVGSCRRELLDHVIVLNESHLRRLVRDYLEYYHDDRIHDALKKDTPTLRVAQRSRMGPLRRECTPSRRTASSLSLANRRLKGRLVQAATPLPRPSRWNK